MDNKELKLPLLRPEQANQRPRAWSWFGRSLLVTLTWVLCLEYMSSVMNDYFEPIPWNTDISCPNQPEPLHPAMTWSPTGEERENLLEQYSQSIQIPTESFDDNGEPNDDPRWKPFFDFREWLKRSFPLAHDAAEIEYINTLGIIATWKGSDPSLKPLLLMSHYDVVPVPDSSLDRWTHPPFSGDRDEQFVWGRGSLDCKSLLTAQWQSITHLLENGWQPRRTLIFTHGNDEEEVFARRGQGHIAPFLEERYGRDGIMMVIDEGMGIGRDYGALMAMPGLSEKGYLDIMISVETDGGHSSTPPEHTGIGIMSQLIDKLEFTPFKQKLTPNSPTLTTLMCNAKYGPTFPPKYKNLLKSPKNWSKLARLIAKESNGKKALVSTTMAVDVIHGGNKINALPDHVTAQINFRIDPNESVGSTQDHVAQALKTVAAKFDFTLEAFGKVIQKKESFGTRFIKAEVEGLAIEPAPITPAQGAIWDLFAGTVRSALPDPNQTEIIVAPYSPTGNSDTKVYHNLSRHIYRFMGGDFDMTAGVHTVDERGTIDGHLQRVNWIHSIIQNTDAFSGDDS